MTADGKKAKKRIGRWQAHRMVRARPADLVFIVSIVLFGLLAVWSGQMMAFRMTPAGAVSTSKMLDELELPRQLPNKPVVDENGRACMLWDLVGSERTLLAVYAPWCPGCQKELPLLVEEVTEKDDLLLLISRQQDVQKTRSQLDNLGLTDLPFYRDVSGKIMEEGKVSKLPTVFLLKKYGKVLDRLVGFSEYKTRRLVEKAQPEK